MQLTQTLVHDPIQGISLGQDCFKIRVAIKSKGKGKSGGARVIIHVVFSDNIIYLLTIYDKAELDTLSPQEIAKLLQQLP